MDIKILTSPLTIAEIKEQADDNCYVSGHILLDLSDAINRDLEEFLDHIATEFVDNILLMDVNYTVVGEKDGMTILLVSGDASMILDADEE
jgi:hypothetical protein